MAIGYANFGTIQQGNQQVVNSMAGLGQSISSAIETHAATQSAQAMLPMLQQQYQSGMAKISAGDPNGLGDIYGAALTASQNPLLAPMAKNAVSMAQSANINAQHMARTQAYAQGRTLGLMAKYPGFIDPTTGQVNPNYQSPTKGITASQKANLVGKYRGATQALWSGGNGVEGAESYVADFLNPAGDQKKADKFASAIRQYNTYKQDLADQGIQFSDPNFENAIVQAGEITSDLQKQAKSNPSEMVGKTSLGWFGKYGGHPVSDDFKTMEARFKEIAPSTIKAAQSSANNQDSLINAAKKAIQNGADPKAVQQRLNQLIQQMQAPSSQSSPAMPANQPTSMIPAAAGMGGVAQGTPEEEDETDAVSGV